MTSSTSSSTISTPLYANVRAFNRWMHEEVGYAAENRMFLPPYIPLADPELAVRELERVIADGAPIIQIKSGHAHGGRDNPLGGRSPADPAFDRFWSICNHNHVRLAAHLIVRVDIASGGVRPLAAPG